MKLSTLLAAAAALAALGVSLSSAAYDADWKRGRVYYRLVCTSCHVAGPVGAINPSSRTKAEWTAYLLLDKHARGKDTVKEYVGKTYRTKIKASNKAAEKFIDVPEQELADDVKSFLVKGAKDGDAPASCN